MYQLPVLAIEEVSLFVVPLELPLIMQLLLVPESLDHCPSSPHKRSDNCIKLLPMLLNLHNSVALVCIGSKSKLERQ